MAACRPAAKACRATVAAYLAAVAVSTALANMNTGRERPAIPSRMTRRKSITYSAEVITNGH